MNKQNKMKNRNVRFQVLSITKHQCVLNFTAYNHDFEFTCTYTHPFGQNHSNPNIIASLHFLVN